MPGSGIAHPPKAAKKNLLVVHLDEHPTPMNTPPKPLNFNPKAGPVWLGADVAGRRPGEAPSTKHRAQVGPPGRRRLGATGCRLLGFVWGFYGF